VYGFGLSEELVGKALEGRRNQAVIATKCGLRWKGNSMGEIYKSLSPASIYEELEASLRRLKTDRIDLYQVHWPDPATPVEHVMTSLYLLKATGKILHIGVSNFTPEMLREAMAIAPVTSLQPKFNLLEREAERELIPLCAENGIGVLAYSPLASGMLTGKYREADWRGRGNMGIFQKEAFPGAMKKVELLREFAREKGVSLTHLALRWAISRPGVTCALAGAYTPEQIEDIAGATSISLTDGEMERAAGLA